MIICGQCGNRAEDGAKFCPVCGSALHAGPVQQVPKPEQTGFCESCGSPVYKNETNCSNCGAPVRINYSADADGAAGDLTPDPAEKNYLIGAYFGIFILIPALKCKNHNDFYKMHMNQGLWISIIMSALFILNINNTLRYVYGVIVMLLLVLSITGIIRVIHADPRPLPILDKIIEKFKFVK